MGRLLPVVLSALLAWIAVTTQALQSCGRSNYDPTKYTCFDDDFLCPIVEGDVLIRCGEACYSTSRFSCSNFTLKPFFPDGPATLQDCGFFIKFDPSFFVCLDGDFICPITNGVAMLKCDQTCYAPAEFGCALNQLYPVGTPPPTCVPEFGDDEVCDENGCFTLPCCGDLISVADKCRDRCMLAPETCPDAHT